MPIITARDLVKSYGTRPILTNVSLTITTGERVGLIGDNGSGKSTLARILAGLEVADAGEVVTRRGARVEVLEQVPRLPPGETALNTVLQGDAPWYVELLRHRQASEALAGDSVAPERHLAEQSAAGEAIERLGGWEREHEARALLARLGIADVDVSIDTLSGGEQRRVALARLLIARPDLAILDEPTNHLDVDTIEWLERTLADDFSGALLLITHDRYVLDRLCDRTVEIDRGQVYIYDGGFEDYLAAKAERLAHQSRTEHNRQRFLKQELEWLRRQPKARTTKQKARIQRAEAAGREAPPPAQRSVALNLDAAQGGKIALELRDLALEIGGRQLLRGLTLGLRQGERLGVLGPNGCGKTTLLRALVGEVTPSRGAAVLGRSQRLSYLDQRRSGLDDRATVYEAIAGDRRTITIGEETLDASAYLQRFLFDGQAAIQRVGTLSGGERARVALARMLQSSASLVILDEPTNDLDIATLAAVEAMLCEFGGTVIVVTHDRYFLDRVATAILAFEDDGTATLYQGNYSTMLALRTQAKEAREAEEAAAQAATRASSTRSAASKPAAPGRGLTYAESIELRGLPEKIDAAEAEVTDLCDRLADPAVYQSGGAQVADLHRRLADARERAAALFGRWEALESKREGS